MLHIRRFQDGRVKFSRTEFIEFFFFKVSKTQDLKEEKKSVCVLAGTSPLPLLFLRSAALSVMRPRSREKKTKISGGEIPRWRQNKLGKMISSAAHFKQKNLCCSEPLGREPRV